MKIIGQQPLTSKELTTGQTKGKESVKDGKSSAENLKNGGSVKTSPFVLNKIKSRIAAEPEIRSDRVADLKARIKSGDYKVDSQQLAAKMLTDSLRDDIS